MHSLNSLKDAYRFFGLDPDFRRKCGPSQDRRTGLTTSIALEVALDVLECPEDTYVICGKTERIRRYLFNNVNGLLEGIGVRAKIEVWSRDFFSNRHFSRAVSFRRTHLYVDHTDLETFLNVHARKVFKSDTDKCFKYLDRYGKLVHKIDKPHITVCSIDSVTDGVRSFYFNSTTKWTWRP